MSGSDSARALMTFSECLLQTANLFDDNEVAELVRSRLAKDAPELDSILRDYSMLADHAAKVNEHEHAEADKVKKAIESRHAALASELQSLQQLYEMCPPAGLADHQAEEGS